jgi:hypothetical protein
MINQVLFKFKDIMSKFYYSAKMLISFHLISFIPLINFLTTYTYCKIISEQIQK